MTLKPARKNLKWWTEDRRDDDIKWRSLVHNGVIFPPAYDPLPAHVRAKPHMDKILENIFTSMRACNVMMTSSGDRWCIMASSSRLHGPSVPAHVLISEYAGNNCESKVYLL